jgi:ATP-dependent Clp protease ATP-binding subunit ClpA
MNENSLLSEWSPRLLQLEEELSKDLPDQPDIVRRVAQSIRKKVALFSDTHWPLGMFLLVGPGDQALRLAGGLARFLFGDAKAIARLNMADFAETDQAIALLGGQAGLGGHCEGRLTEPIWRRPQSVMVLEEVDKGHPDSLRMLAQIWEEGNLTDGLGRIVSFQRAILILTTMVGHAEAHASPDYVVGRGSMPCRGHIPRETVEALETFFPPENLRCSDLLLVR